MGVICLMRGICGMYLSYERNMWEVSVLSEEYVAGICLMRGICGRYLSYERNVWEVLHVTLNLEGKMKWASKM